MHRKNSRETLTNALRGALFLGLFALVATALVAATHQLTRERIAENERLAVLRGLHEIISPTLHDNDLVRDVVYVTDPELLGDDEPKPVYRARKGGKPVAVIITTVAPDGYGGKIKLLVGIDTQGRILGVRAVSHKETPGLGDAIEPEKSDWILRFTGKSLGDPPEKRWKVKRDGGAFDQFTGATITPRAVVKAVKKALLFYRQHRDTLFQRPSEVPPEEEEP